MGGDKIDEPLSGSKFVVYNVIDNKVFTTDTKSENNKIFVVNARSYEHLKYVFSGDTIEYFNNKHFFKKGNEVIDIPSRGYLKFNGDSLCARQNRRFYAHTRYEKMMCQR